MRWRLAELRPIGGIDSATGSDHADHNAFVDPADRARLQLSNQLGVRLQRLGHHHQAGGVLVQTMHDTGARHIDDVRHMVQQGIEQGAIGMPGSRVHHQPSRLVDHQQVIVLVNDVQRDILRHPLTLGFLFGFQLQHRTEVHHIARTQYRAVDSQAPFLDPAGQARTRVFSKELCSDLIKALTAHLERHFGT